MSNCLVNCSNCFSSKIALYNPKTQKIIKPHCRTYTCPDHGWKKAKELAEGIEKWLSQFERVRMFTFTIRNTGEFKNETFNYLFAKVWHRFIVELRRSKVLTKKQRNVQYIKVYELHKVGTLHVHALMSEYFHWATIQTIWQKAIRTYFNIKGKSGNVNVKGSRSAKGGAKYVSKYVTKMAKQGLLRVRSWSKSGKVAIFKKRIKTDVWIMLRRNTQDYRLAKLGFPILVREVSCVTENLIKMRKKLEHPRIFYERFNYFLGHFVFPRFF